MKHFTITNFSNGIVPIDISSGATLDFGGQAFTTSATAGYIKNNSGVLALGGGAYGGGFTLNAGTVIVRGVNAMGGAATNTLTLNGGILASNANRSLTGKYAGGITIGGNIQFGDVVGLAVSTANLTFDNNMSLGGTTRTLTLGNGGSMTFGGVISNAAGVGVTFAANANGTGQFLITNTTNTYTGTTTITGGEARFSVDGSLGAVPGSSTANSIVLDGGRLGFPSTASFTLNANRGIQISAATGNGINVVGAGVVTYNGVLADLPSTTGTWNKLGTGTLILGGVSTYTGGTTISEGNLQLNSGNDRLPTTTTLTFPTGSNANVLLLGNDTFGGAINQTVAGLLSTGSAVTSSVVGNTVSNSTLTVNNTSSNTFNGTIGGLGTNSNNLNIIKTNSGTLALGGANTYTGTTLVSGGKLLVNGTHTGGGTYTVDTGGTLGGNGTINANVNVVTGTLAPGNSPDRLTINGAVAFTNTTSSVFSVEINGPNVVTDYDQLRVGSGGSLNVTGATLAASLGFDPVGTEKIFITDDLFAGAVTGTFNNLPEGASISLTSPSSITYTGTISYLGDFSTLSLTGGNDIVIYNLSAAIPEPGTIALLGLTGFFGVQWYLRRKPAVAKQEGEKAEGEIAAEPAPAEATA